MPQTMQQKREGSLKRLIESCTNANKTYAIFPGTGSIKEARDRHVANLRRLIAQTEAAIQRGRQYHSTTGKEL